MLVIVMVLVPLLPCFTVTRVGDAAMVKFGLAVAVTVRESVVVAVKLPDVPVMVTVEVPVVAVLLAVSVSTLVPVVGFVPNAAVTPLGRPDAASVTLPENPPTSVTVMVLVPLPPWVIDRLVGESESVKLGVADPARVLIKPERVRAAPAGAQIVIGVCRIGAAATAGDVVEQSAVARA